MSEIIPEISAGRSRLLVLLFTDLVGSTGLKNELTTTGYLPLLRGTMSYSGRRLPRPVASSTKTPAMAASRSSPLPATRCGRRSHSIQSQC